MKILIIDDDQATLNVLEYSLEKFGHDVTGMLNPVEAVVKYKSEKFDAVITDFKMPEMDGIEVLKKIREYDCNAVVIVLTGYADIENAIDAVNNGAYAFFRKPLDIKDLIKTFEKIENNMNGKLKKESDLKKLYHEYKKLKNSFESLKEIIENITVSEKEKSINE